MRRARVTIVYKSGATVTLRCKAFSVSTSKLDGHVTGVSWKDAKPEPLLAGVDEIVAVWSHVRRWWWR